MRRHFLVARAVRLREEALILFALSLLDSLQRVVARHRHALNQRVLCGGISLAVLLGNLLSYSGRAGELVSVMKLLTLRRM